MGPHGAKKYKMSQKSVAWVTWPAFKISGPCNISGMDDGTNLKFCTQHEGLGYYLLRLRSSCPCWGTWRRVVSIGHDHWQHFWFRHECHCHWHPLLLCLPWTCPATSALAYPIFCILALESSLLL